MDTEKLIIVFVAVLVAVAAVIVVFEQPALADGNRMGFVLCNPSSYIYVRTEPSKNGSVCGYLNCGDAVTLDGEEKGQWLHIVDTCFDGDAWVSGRYVVGIKVSVFEKPVEMRARAKVRVRNYVGGKVTKTLIKGDIVKVYAYSEQCCLTNRGYVVTKYLEEVE